MGGNLQKIFLSVLATSNIALVACGGYETEEEVTSSRSLSAVKQTERQLQVANEASFSLTAATKYKIQIESCKSGFKNVATETSPNLQLYKDDRGCLGRLVEFSHRGKNYLPDPGRGFSTLAVGDKGTFVSDDGQDFFEARIVAQISNPVLLSDKVDFKFTAVKAGTRNAGILKTIEGLSGTATPKVGQKPPHLNLQSSALMNVLPQKAAGQFVFTFECQSKLTNLGTAPKCLEDKLSDMSYALVKDKYNDVPCVTKGVAGCDQIFSSGSTPVNVKVDYIAPGTEGLPNGGFRTKILTGPDNLATNPNMVLLVRDGIGAYQYFNVDMQTSSTLYLTELALSGLSSHP